MGLCGNVLDTTAAGTEIKKGKKGGQGESWIDGGQIIGGLGAYCKSFDFYSKENGNSSEPGRVWPDSDFKE